MRKSPLECLRHGGTTFTPSDPFPPFVEVAASFAAIEGNAIGSEGTARASLHVLLLTPLLALAHRAPGPPSYRCRCYDACVFQGSCDRW